MRVALDIFSFLKFKEFEIYDMEKIKIFYATSIHLRKKSMGIYISDNYGDIGMSFTYFDDFYWDVPEN
jgi:hypothetical protein